MRDLKVLTGNEDIHKLIYCKESLKVIPDVPIYIKIEAKLLEQPCNFRIKYHSNGDLNVFVSLKNRVPDSRGPCEYEKLNNPTLLTIYSEGRRTGNLKEIKFSEPWIYIGLESAFGVQITCSVKFAET